jgi:hypothetical protein
MTYLLDIRVFLYKSVYFRCHTKQKLGGGGDRTVTSELVTPTFPISILWYVDPLLGNDREICSNTTAVAW